MVSIFSKEFWLGPEYKPELIPEQVRSGIAVPDMTTSPPTWHEVNLHTFVTPDEALTIPALQRAVAFVATAVAQLDLEVSRQGQVIASPLASRPDYTMTLSAFLKRTVYDLALRGNCYWRLYRNSDGAVVNMEIIHPDRVRAYYDVKGNILYDYTDAIGKTYQGLTKNVPGNNAGQIEHLRVGPEDALRIVGRSPVQLNNRALRQILNLAEYYDGFLNDANRPRGIWNFPKADFDDDELTQVQQRIVDAETNGKPRVLWNGTQYQSLYDPAAAQIVEFQKAAVADVARMYGIPAPMLNAEVIGHAMTYQNMLTVSQQFVLYGLEEYLTCIEDAFTCVLPNGQSAQFNTDNWLRSQQAMAAASASATAPADQSQGGSTEQVPTESK